MPCISLRDLPSDCSIFNNFVPVVLSVDNGRRQILATRWILIWSFRGCFSSVWLLGRIRRNSARILPLLQLDLWSGGHPCTFSHEKSIVRVSLCLCQATLKPIFQRFQSRQITCDHSYSQVIESNQTFRAKKAPAAKFRCPVCEEVGPDARKHDRTYRSLDLKDLEGAILQRFAKQCSRVTSLSSFSAE